MVKKTLLVFCFAILSAAWGLAQNSPNTGHSTTSEATSVQGCLSGSGGNYMLTADNSGATYKLVGNEAQLKKHVGHEVAITGQATGESESSQSEPQQSPSAGSNATVIQVTSVKMISKQCGSASNSTQPQ